MRKEWMEKDYYADLSLSKDASDKEIKKAFRKLARTFHPDNNPDDAAAEARFKEINEAYETLSDAEERKEYDHVREMGYFVGGPGGNQEYVRVEDKWVPREMSGTNPSCIRANSQITDTVSISENDTGTPSEGDVVPHRPGPINMTMFALCSPVKWLRRPMRRATEYRSLIPI